ncbi:uncharacterized protein LOC142979636 [Anticarsia gemmatalis]|uniref:uncharacterized protein LOC142979636 n=1 Tax=Anticarsia gemmatalis TaxID=129554 RepID=UPI003F770753
MSPYQSFVFFFINLSFIITSAQYYDYRSNNFRSQSNPTLAPNFRNPYGIQERLRQFQQEKVRIDLYYECLCPDCRHFDTEQFAPTVRKLGNYLDVHLYPYGNAKTIKFDNGTFQVICQHGPAECYGNMLHACAIDQLADLRKAIDYNTCMMDFAQSNRGSDDEAADKCGRLMNIDSESIKSCARGPRGLALLKYYGDESQKVGFKWVPYILINGAPNQGDNFFRDVCSAFKKPPQECNEIMHCAVSLYLPGNLSLVVIQQCTMTCFKLLLVQLLITFAKCSQDPQNEDQPSFWNQITNWNRTTEMPPDVSALKDKVQLKVYYETLCPASVDFFVSQLKPAVKRLGEHLDVHLIPYGHATTHNTRGYYTFECQHGPKECYANRVHACAIDVLQNTTRSINFLGCLMQYTSYHGNYDYFVSVLTTCSFTENVNISEIGMCVNSPRGAIVLKQYGDETHELEPSYVPYIVLDGSSQYQDRAAGNLVDTVCQLLNPKPSVCFNNN